MSSELIMSVIKYAIALVIGGSIGGLIGYRRAFRMEDEKEDYSWAMRLDDSERLEIATRLVSDLWSAANNGSPFPSMDRTVYNYITVAATDAKI